MKKTIFMLPALALMLFAACSSEDAVTKDNTAQLNETPDNAIGFNAYINRATTRAGKVGVLNNDALQDGVTAGFGVFAYYADGDLYTENATPNFMYNQHVWYNSGWTYEPVKYWPNEFGSQAISTGVDRVTFFAYAPYVAVEPATGQLTSTYTGEQTTTGITSLTRNGKSGDPYVRYVGTFDYTKCVDLCYGVAAEAFTSSVGSGDGANSINKGEPYINVAKPAVGSKIYFDFKHALAMLNVNVDADVDIVSHDNGESLDGNTRIWVRSITFDGIAQRGYLNLNSGIWYDIMDNNKISHASVTIHDGRRDGSEALSDDTYESPTGFNGALVQSGAYTASPASGTTFPYTTFSSTTTGVTGANQDLFGGSLMVIPANEQLKVTIVYDVETADATLPTYLSDGSTKGSTVENKITKSITLNGNALKLESGKAYTLNLHLGMTGVKFDAQVSEWSNGGTADNPWLPENSPTIKAGTANYPYSAPAALGTHTYKNTDLTAGSTRTVTVESGNTIIFSPSVPTFDNEDNVSGILSATVTENKSVKDKTATIKLAESGTGSKTTTIKITQAAAPLGLSVSAVAAEGKSITLAATAEDVTGDIWDGATITVLRNRNGVITELTKGTKTAGSKFELDGTDKNKIVFADADEVKVGDIYTITVVPGEGKSAPETVTAKIGGIAFVPATYNVEYGTTGFAPTPIRYGGTLGAYSDASSTVTAVADVTSATDPTIIINKVGTAKISMKNTLTSPEAGYFFTNGSQTASYTLNVTKAAATISFVNPSPADKPDQAIGSGSGVSSNAVVLKNSKGAELTIGADAGGEIAYSVSAVRTADGSDASSLFYISSTTGAVSVKSGSSLASGTTYTITVTATVTPTANASYSKTTATYTIKVTTVS